ncbi:putative FAD dependent oxidoreductase [Lyophyllum shimeji]|uniref:FAD dependent oxidoreductase n=1 Tax=Lyophyllum shimeji TaxID=47721 RepID=A0A9P3PQ06_LYOSH|nr:putative FAD dependent oxidoreductase [Lyophyllum shimeji]
MAQSEQRSIVIIGGGIIGCTSAYYLTHHPSFDASQAKLIILEASAHGAAQGASGKAGGLVARWAYPQPLVDVSFNEHVRLAERHNGAERWGWRFVGCGSWEGRAEEVPEPVPGAGGSEVQGEATVGRRKSLEKTIGLESQPHRKTRKRATGLPDDLTWMEEDLTDAYSPMAPPGDTAQVHPYKFTTSMLALAQEKGAEFIRGRATRILSERGRVTGIAYTEPSTQQEQQLPATHVILAAGAWAPMLLPGLPIAGTRAHSITIHPPPHLLPIAPYALFTDIALPPSSGSLSRRTRHGVPHATPEFYARPGPEGEVYACGPGDDAPLPAGGVDEVEVDQRACEEVWRQVRAVSRVLRAGNVQARQACYLPVVQGRRQGPIIGEAKERARGLIVAAGHTCWGICNAPGTGRAIAELVMEGEIKCADLRSLQPGLFI